MDINRTYSDTVRRTAAIGGAVVTVALALMFFVEAFGIWRPLGQSLTWGAAVLPALLWTIWFATTTRYQLRLDEAGITRTRGKHEVHVPWSKVSDVVEFPNRHRHLAVLSQEAEFERTPGEMGMIRAYRLPRFGVVLQADDEVRAAVAERSGKPVRPAEEIVL